MRCKEQDILNLVVPKIGPFPRGKFNKREYLGELINNTSFTFHHTLLDSLTRLFSIYRRGNNSLEGSKNLNPGLKNTKSHPISVITTGTFGRMLKKQVGA